MWEHQEDTCAHTTGNILRLLFLEESARKQLDQLLPHVHVSFLNRRLLRCWFAETPQSGQTAARPCEELFGHLMLMLLLLLYESINGSGVAFVRKS